jgi:hypothetical protein
VTSRGELPSLAFIDTNPSLLADLGLKTSTLEKCHEDFSRLWRSYEFTVKTFLKGNGLSRVNIASANEKVISGTS